MTTGVLDVKKESVIEKAIQEAGIQVKTDNLDELVEKFVLSVCEKIDKGKKQVQRIYVSG